MKVSQVLALHIFRFLLKLKRQLKYFKMEDKIYKPVLITDRLPSIKGWYNLVSDAIPNACGRAWFDGNDFVLKMRQHDFLGLLQRGFKLFWLEQH